MTERIQAGTDFGQSSRQFTDIINFLPDATFVIDRTGTVIAWNSAIEEMTSVPAEQMLGCGDYAYAIPFYGLRRPVLINLVLQPGDRIENNHYHIIRQEGNLLIAELDLPHPIGKSTHLWAKASPLYDEQGTTIGAIESIRDVTPHKQAQIALENAREFAETVIETANAIIVGHDTAGRITLFNQAAEKTTGYTRAELEGKNWFEVVVPRDRFSSVYEELDHLTGDGIPKQLEIPLLTKTGDVRHITWQNNEIREQGTIVGTISIGIDITDRITAEDELKMLYTNLEQRIVERTADLRKTEEAYHRANVKLNLLSSITRHDILNQLMVVSGFLELAAKNVADEQTRGHIQKAMHASAAVERHIVFTRLYQNIGVKAPQWQNLRTCAEKQITDLRPESVSVGMDITGIEIFSDPLFEKGLYTLVDNTLRHSETATEIRLSCRHKDTGELVLIYEDNGVGIPSEDKEHIFERGFGKNTGFGLFLAREILAITDITIRETGEPGNSARFEITVPPGAWRLQGA
ncbi:PAS domain S-box protein [Methanoregula sp.]|uniref:PAS domain S-box protein n=1 Tax=Methanoregula sp. TaxID=2052170 RepID=UPI0023753D47|nr:PAS domain S-box protein [Methanoregula sp.]MDD1686419.1 PAS domain S-box protein [Methanoregula sp.]